MKTENFIKKCADEGTNPFICEPCGYKCKSKDIGELMALHLAHKKGQHYTRLGWFNLQETIK